MAGRGGPIDGLIRNEVKKLLKIMQREGLEEVSLEHGDTRIRLRRSPQGPHAGEEEAPDPGSVDLEYGARLAGPAEAGAEGPAVRRRGRPRKQAAPADAGFEARTFIRSPMVGTFYRAASPELPSLVDAGDSIAVGQRVAIVEAMKLMNEVESEVAGILEEVLVENGQMVEFGQPLFRLRPA